MERHVYEIPVEHLRQPFRGKETPPSASRRAPAPDVSTPPVSTTPPPEGFVPSESPRGYADAAPPVGPAPPAHSPAASPTASPPPSAADPPPAATPPPPAAPQPPVSSFPPPAYPAAPADFPATGSGDSAPAEPGGRNAESGAAAGDAQLVAALQSVLQYGASDLHVTAGAAPTLRIDGALQPLPGAPIWDSARVTEALRSLLTSDQIERFAQDLELDFSYSISENSRFRVNFYQQRGHLAGAFRIIPTEIRQLAELGVPESIGQFAALPRGLVLVTGPTGSGKSTTLAALVDLVNRTRTDHIVTVEDPIEFLHANQKSVVNQREVGFDTHGFGAALRHILRQDPDVILIGELRDLETISVALTAAETGHLVFATLHTQDAAQTVDRIIDVFPPHQQAQVRAQVAATLKGVVCQTLVKRASGPGRVVATEIMISTPAVENLIREGKTYQIHSVLQAGRGLGMHTLDQNLADFVNAGTITHEAAYEKTRDPIDLDQLIARTAPDSRAQHSGQIGDIDFGDAFSPGVH